MNIYYEKSKSLLLEMTGSLLVAIALANFAAAFEFPMTGFSGIALILYRLFHIPLGFTNLILNIPIAIFCYRLLGKQFFYRSLRCMIISSLMMDYLCPLLPVYTGDRLLAALCTGILSGLGYALIYMQNSSTGGAAFIIMAVKAYKPHVALGNITFLCAALIISANWLIFRDTDGVLYGLIINYLSGIVINHTMYGANSGKVTMVVTEHGKKIADAIENCCHRGSTIINAFGGYQEANKQMVFCACSNKQMYQLKKVIKDTDPASFMVVWESNEVQGEGFRIVSVGQDE